jgi:hypothetical protein
MSKHIFYRHKGQGTWSEGFIIEDSPAEGLIKIGANPYTVFPWVFSIDEIEIKEAHKQ